MTDQPTRLEVTPEDRELYSALYLWMNEEKRLAMAGDFDERPAMQTIARHRLVHTVPGDADLARAAKGVLHFRVGELPSRGYLRDNDQSRAALARLDQALSTSPVIDTNEGLAERVRLLDDEIIPTLSAIKATIVARDFDDVAGRHFKAMIEDLLAKNARAALDQGER